MPGLLSSPGFGSRASDHVRGHAVKDDVSGHPQQVHFLEPSDSVLVLQQVVAVHRHFKRVLLHEDLQLQEGGGAKES